MFQATFSKLTVICEWIAKLALLNLLFIFFSCAGLIIFGVSPAYSAMTIILKKLYAQQDVAIIKTFYQLFKRELVASNKFGLLYNYIFILLFINFILAQTLPASLHTVAIGVITLCALIFFLSWLYVHPLYVSYEATVWQLIRNSFKMAIAFFPRTLLLTATIAAIVIICCYQPILIILFAFSSINAVSLLNSQHCFKKIMQTA